MIYLDYSATTPVDKEVLESFNKVSLSFIGNPNSLHKLGVDSNKLIRSATSQLASILKVKENEIIYTSGASESNNLALKGIAYKYQNRGKHIITTNFEHSSIYGPLNFLEKEGFEIDYVKTDKSGKVDLLDLKNKLRDDTILVSITAVNSEIGIIEPIKEIGNILKDYPKCFFHVDMTQLVGKKEIDLSNIDLASFSTHKFYGLKGVGVLVKKEKIMLEPLIHGGKSTTIYRSGTPSPALITSTSKALRIACENLNEKYNYVQKLNDKIRTKLKTYEKVSINSPIDAIPHILNISILGCKPETILHFLEEKEVYISTQTACSSKSSMSDAVYALTNDEKISSSSVRISLSYKTTMEEIEKFLSIFDSCYNHLTNLR